MKTFRASALLAFGVACANAHAQPPQTKQDVSLLLDATEAVDTLKKSGLDKLTARIVDCYAKVGRVDSKSRREHVQHCVGLDLSAEYMDTAVSRAAHFPADPNYQEAKIKARVQTALRASGQSSTSEATQAYIDALNPRIRDYTGRAMQVAFGKAAN